MRTYHPVVFTWVEVDVVDEHGVATRCKAMVPLKRYDNLAKRQFEDKEEYPLAPIETRSRASHNHFFAALADGFENLPERIAARWATSEHLRAWLLVETGWFTEEEFTFDNERDAKRFGTFFRKEKAYARIFITGKKVIIRNPKSQSAVAMGKDAFQKSKTDCLEMLDHLIGQSPGTLNKEARRRA